MKEFTTDRIRNVCLAGQRGSGKTSLADAIAFVTGLNSRIGRVDDGSSLLDHTSYEISRKTSLFSSLLATSWNNTKLNILDCPGHLEFVGELIAAARVCDTIGFLVDATSGVEIGTQLQWKLLPETSNVRFFFVNKLEKENADWKKSLDSIRTAFGKQAVAVQIPIGQAASFSGIIDLIHMKAYTFDSDGNRKEVDIPADLKSDADTERNKLVEIAAESDDALIEKYFEEGTLSDADVQKGFAAGVRNGSLYPVLFGSAIRNMGIKVLLQFAADVLPSPAEITGVTLTNTGTMDEIMLPTDSAGPAVAYIFKTASEGHLGEMSYFRTISGTLKAGIELVNQQISSGERISQVYSLQGKNRIELSSAPAGDIGVLVKLKHSHTGNTLCAKGTEVSVVPTEFPIPVMDVSISPKSKGDEDKLTSSLNKLHDEDPTFRLELNPALRQQVMWAQGSTHIEVTMEKLKDRFGVEAVLGRPRIPYRETVRSKNEKQYRHKKQSGGRGQFGEVHIRIEPNERGKGFEFVDAIKGGVIPSKFIPAVEKGIAESMQRGGLAGAPVVDVKVTLFYGQYHDVDSSDMAFKIAGSTAFREGYMESKPVLLEPIFNVEVLVPDEFTGDVMGDLSSRRGKIAGMTPEGGSQRIHASVPQAELYQYSVNLRSMTQGQGVYTMEFSRYEDVPHDQTQKVIAAAKEADAS